MKQGFYWQNQYIKRETTKVISTPITLVSDRVPIHKQHGIIQIVILIIAIYPRLFKQIIPTTNYIKRSKKE